MSTMALAQRLRCSVASQRTSLLLLALTLSCSETPTEGEGASAAGGGVGGGGGLCATAFCLEDDIRAQLQPASLAFPDLEPGENLVQEVKVRHIGARGVLTISKASFLQDGQEFGLIAFTTMTLQPGGEAALQVRYAPTKTGKKVAQLLLTTNATLEAMRTIVLPLSVHPGVGALKALPDPVDFGGVAVGATADGSATLANHGAKPVVLESLAIEGPAGHPFAVLEPPTLPMNLAANGTLAVKLRCAPLQEGSAEATLRVGYDGDKVATTTLLAETPGPKILVTPPALSFGSLSKGDTATQQVTITSNGASKLDVASITLSPLSKVKSVKVSDPGPFSLLPGESRTLDVTLTLDVELGSASGIVASLIVKSNASPAEISVPLSLTGKPCVRSESKASVQATAIGGQVDVLVAIDTSGSMKEEAKAVQANLNNFAKIIAAKAIDAHVVLLADGFGLCVPPPLGGPSCADSSQFRHIKVKVDSTDALERIISSYPLYKDFLRVGAARHLVVVSDDKSDKDGKWFEGKLAGLTDPGFPDGFVLHGVVSWSDELPFLPCLGGAGWGGVYMDLAKKTGGELAKICTPDWTQVFTAIGANVIKTVKVQCIYPLPLGSDGAPVPLGELTLSWSEGSGTAKDIPQVNSAAACPKDSVGWHADNAAAPKAAVLCPATCDALGGKTLHFHFGCP